MRQLECTTMKKPYLSVNVTVAPGLYVVLVKTRIGKTQLPEQLNFYSMKQYIFYTITINN